MRWRRRRYVDKMRETDGFVDGGRRRRRLPKELRLGRLLCPKKESFFRPEKREGKAGGAWIIFLRQKTLSSPHAGFLSAAQPTDQGEESVVLLLIVVVVGGGTIFQSPMCSFLGCEKAKNFV